MSDQHIKFVMFFDGPDQDDLMLEVTMPPTVTKVDEIGNPVAYSDEHATKLFRDVRARLMGVGFKPRPRYASSNSGSGDNTSNLPPAPGGPNIETLPVQAIQKTLTKAGDPFLRVFIAPRYMKFGASAYKEVIPVDFDLDGMGTDQQAPPPELAFAAVDHDTKKVLHFRAAA